MGKETNVISYKRTVVGWFNFKLSDLTIYNIDPVAFSNITGVNAQAYCGTCELTGSELDALKKSSVLIGEQNKVAL